MSFLSRFVSAAILISFVWPPFNAQASERSERKKQDEASVRAIQTFQPPPARSIETYCEPIRQEIVRLGQKPFLVRLGNQPHRQLLIRRHRDCVSRVMDQEYTYLKHVDIQQAPRLPVLKTDMPADNPQGATESSSSAPSSTPPDQAGSP